MSESVEYPKSITCKDGLKVTVTSAEEEERWLNALPPPEPEPVPVPEPAPEPHPEPDPEPDAAPKRQRGHR